MKSLYKPIWLAMASASVAVIALPASVATAQQSQEEAIEEIITTGIRGRPRTAMDSAVPVDTFNVDAIEAVSHTDTVDILQTLVPSYNVSREPISDGSTFIRPATLRGLPPHHTLVLINGKRRHRASLVTIGTDGDQGPDVATIPSTAVKNVEVLRDGASSLYGSDAIAGVINFILKDDADGFTLRAGTGSFFEGDGDEYTISANIGLPLTENGFISISAEVTEADFTERAEAYCESWFCVDPSNSRFGGSNIVSRAFASGDPSILTPGVETDSGGFLTAADIAYLTPFINAYPDGTLNPHSASVEGTVTMPWGVPNAEAVRTFVNAGIEMQNGMELYGWGNYSSSKGDGSFFYRYPFNATIEMLRNADGSRYFPLEKFPGGFTPRFEGEVEDVGALIGLRGETDGGFTWDLSARYGSDEIDYRLFNTINPSYGVDSPTDFKPGTLTNEEVQFQADFSNELDMGGVSDVVVAYGLSYMDEEYDVGQSGDLASYDAGPHALQDPFGFCAVDAMGNFTGAPTTVAGGGVWTSSIGGQAAVAGNTIADLDCSNPDDPVFGVVGVGANGFPGYSPAFSDKYTRDSWAVYGEISADLTDALFVQAAIRYEDYSDFGNETVGKLAGLYRVNEAFAIRGSVGTGFRAPTPGQQGTTNVSTRLPNGFPVATGLFPASSGVAVALGAVPLKAEESTNWTLGFTADVGELSLTVDYYNIAIDDRFRAISTRDVSPDPLGDPDAFANYLALVNAGVIGAETIGGVFYFQNALDSTTSGVDIVAAYPIAWNNGQDTNFQLAFNWNESELDADLLNVLNPEDEFDFENAVPNTRWNLTAVHSFNDSWSAMGRVRYYGEYDNSDNTTPLSIQSLDAVLFFDLEASYQLNDNWRFTVGGRNIFDEFPDRTDRVASDNDFCCGRTYQSSSVVPWQGGYYYGRVMASF